jgi:hypothetical protein
MADCMLDIEWGETPFTFGDPRWPSPLIQPSPWTPQSGMVKVVIPDEFLDRWRKAEAEFIACQQELIRIAREAGEIGEP